MQETAVIILAAGQGKRLRSSVSKVLHPLAGAKVIDYPLRLAQSLVPAQIVVVAPPGDNPLSAYLAEHYPQVKIAVQATPKGTGDAVSCAKRFFRGFTGDILILCGDVPLLRKQTLTQFYKYHTKQSATLSLMTCTLDDPATYGRIVRTPEETFSHIVEYKDASKTERAIREINGGIYWVKAPALFKALQKLTPDNEQQEYYLTDVAHSLGRNHRVVTWALSDPTELQGINTRCDLADAHTILYDRTRDRLLNEGVTLVDPATVYAEPSVSLGEDCVVEPNVYLRGKTQIGKNTRIATGCVIDGTLIGDRVTLLPYCVIKDSHIDHDVQIGPFAHLRPQSHLKAGAKAGNFVEMKKTVLGEGSKLNHLSYAGDAIIGKNVNVGAGTITCNYDGTRKWVTEIDDGAFIGSNTSLVAPVKIGKHSVVGAGSVITKAVPDQALGLTRAPQRTIEGWTARKAAHHKESH